MLRIFCSTVFIFDETGDKCLFIKHKKLNRWIPPGGKLDHNELPEEAAVRECLEETGLNVQLIGEYPGTKGGLIRPSGMQLYQVIPGQKEHIDFMYTAKVIGNKNPKLKADEAHDISWFSVEAITSQEFDTFDDVKIWTKKLAIEFKQK